MGKTIISYFFLVLLVNSHFLEIQRKKIKNQAKITNQNRETAFNASEKKSHSQIETSNLKKRNSFFQRFHLLKNSKRFSSQKLRKFREIFTLTALLIGILVSSGTVLASALLGGAASFGISVTAGIILGIGASFAIGTVTVLAIIEANREEYAKNIFQLYSNQLYAKNKFCYGVKNINAIVDDLFEFALMRNYIDTLRGDEITNPEQKTSYLEETSDFDKYINMIWSSNKEFETMVCAKAIDFVGETRFFENTITQMAPDVENYQNIKGQIFSLIGRVFKLLIAFLAKLYEFVKYLKAISNLSFSVDGSSGFSSSIFGDYEKDKIQENPLQKAMIELLDYKPEVSFNSPSFKIAIFKFKITNDKYEFENKGLSSETCPLGCAIQEFSSTIEESVIKYSTTIQNLLTSQNLNTQDLNTIKGHLKDIGVKLIFDLVFIMNYQKNIENNIQTLAKQLIEIVQDITSKETVKQEAEKKEKFFKVELDALASKIQDKAFEIIATHMIQNQIQQFSGFIVQLEPLIQEYKDISELNKEKKETQLNQIKTLSDNLTLFVTKSIHKGFSLFGVIIGIILKVLPTILKSLISKKLFAIIVKLKGFAVILAKILIYIQIFGAILAVVASAYLLISKLCELRAIKKKYLLNNVLAENYHILVVLHLNYLLPKYLIYSINNLEKINQFFMREAFLNNVDLSLFNETEESTQVEVSSIDPDLKAKLNAQQQAFEGKITEKMKVYFKRIAHKNANFAYKYFSFNFVDNYFKDPAFYKELQIIFMTILYEGPISDLVVVDDNLLNRYGFAENNPGYRMYKGPGKQFNTSKDLTALMYCRGCVSHSKLIFIDFVEDLEENDLILKMKSWMDSGKPSVCQDIAYVDITMKEKVKESVFKYSFMRTCLKRIEIPEGRLTNVSIKEKLISKIFFNKSAVLDFTYSDFNTKFFDYVEIPNFETTLKPQIVNFQCFLTVNEAIKKMEIALDSYFIEVNKDSKLKEKNCVFYTSKSDQLIADNEEMLTFRDNFIFLKVHRQKLSNLKSNQSNLSGDQLKKKEEEIKKFEEIYFYHQIENPNKFTEILTFKDNEVEKEYSFNGFDTIFKPSGQKHPQSCPYRVNDEIIVDIRDSLFLNQNSNMDSTIKTLYCFEKTIKEFNAKICFDEKEAKGVETSQEPAISDKIKEKLDKEYKMLLNKKYEDESKFAFKFYVSWSNTLIGGSCPGDNIPPELLPMFKLYFQNPTSMKFYENNDNPDFSIENPLPTFEQFKNSLEGFKLKKFGRELPEIPFFYDYITDGGRDQIPEQKIYKSNVEYQNTQFADSDSNTYLCIKRTDLRILFPARKTNLEDFYLRKIANDIAFSEFAPKISLVQLILKNNEEQKAMPGFQGAMLEEIPKNDIYFIEVFLRNHYCKNISQEDLHTEHLKHPENMKFLLLKQYLPFYPRKYEDNTSATPQANLLFQFPFAYDYCFMFRLWIKINHSDLKKEKEDFCLSRTQTKDSEVKKSVGAQDVRKKRSKRLLK